jgi:ComF family protein
MLDHVYVKGKKVSKMRRSAIEEPNLLKRISTLLQVHKNCYICRQASSKVVCDICGRDTVLPHFPVPGFDLLQNPNIAQHLVMPYYQHLYAIGEYRGILKPLINRLKFANQPIAAQVLAHFFMRSVYPRIAQLGELPDAIVPLPLSMWRYANRGYNQARLLAQSISQISHIPMYEGLSRKRHTKAQSSLDREARLHNIEGAFAITKACKFEHIALIDDVITTGATVNSACKTIVDAYPDITISVWSMAITPPTHEYKASQ